MREKNVYVKASLGGDWQHFQGTEKATLIHKNKSQTMVFLSRHRNK